MIRIRGLEVPVNVKAEIEPFDWYRPKWKEERLIACSPFRDETSPSFAVNLENGTWIDSGGEGDFYKGNFVKLYAYLNNISYEEAEDDLIMSYSPNYGEVDKLELSFDDLIEKDTGGQVFDRNDLRPFAYHHPYLNRRGIPTNVQQAFNVGYDPETESVVLVWHDLNGNIVNWKHRSVKSKAFWYVKDGQPIRKHLYGIEWVVKRGYKDIWVVESEIDALTLWSQGIPSVAIGTSYLSKEKRDLILKAGIESLTIATDNDRQGAKAKRSIVSKLGGRLTLYEIEWGDSQYKDVNEAREIIKDLVITDVDVISL